MGTLRIGIVAKPQGIKGELKILPLTDDPGRFIGMESLLVEEGKEFHEMTIEHISLRGNEVIVKLRGLDDRNAAEAYRNKYLCVDRSQAIKLPPGRYFISDLIGCEVFDTDGKALGKLADVLELPANHVYVIDGARQFMVPALKTLLNQVDVGQKRMVFDAKVLEEVAVYDEG